MLFPIKSRKSCDSSLLFEFTEIDSLDTYSIMSIFDAYDAEFSALKQEIAKNVAEFREDTGAPKPKLIEGLFLQANDLIKQMEIEARSSDSSSRKILNEKVSKYKKSVQTLKSEYNIIKTQHDKSDLINAEPKSKSAEQRQRLLDSNDR